MPLNSPRTIPTAHTLEFLRRVLPAGAARILDVGCGDGAVAERLKSDGRVVTAIDRSPEAVRAATARGVRAIAVDFLDYKNNPFDVVFFSRSLHHLAPLTKAVEHARELLVPGGLLVAEEFAIENVDLETARWFFELSDLLEAIGLISPATNGVVAASNQLERWYAEHAAEQPIHAAEDMLLAVGARLKLMSHEKSPYLYRYVSERIEATERGVRVARWMLDVESMRVTNGSLRAVGVRLVARKAPG